MSDETPRARLRAAAEAKLAGAALTSASGELLHELQVHQIELEMQNEALRQSQAELEAARDRYLDLYEFAPVGYLTLAPNGQIADANLTAAAMLGVDRKDLRQIRFDRMVHVVGRTRWEHTFIAAKATDDPMMCDVALTQRDGSPGTDVHVDIRRGTAAGGEMSLRVTLTDISELKRAEVALAHV